MAGKASNEANDGDTTTVSEEKFYELVEQKAAEAGKEAAGETKEEIAENAAQEAAKAAVNVVSHIFKPPDDDAAAAAKAIAKQLPGDVQGEVEEAIKKALREKQNAHKGGTEQFALTQMTELGEDPANKVFDEPIAEKMKGHWLGDKAQYNNNKIGSGKVAADMLFYCMRSIQEFGGLKWSFIQEEAERRGSTQVKRIVEKNQQDTDFSEGGALIPPEFAADVIGFLHGSTAVRSIDHVSMELTSELIQSRISGTATANYRGEGGSTDSSTIGTDQIRFSENELVVRIIQSKRFVRNAPAGALQMMRDDMRNVARTKQDKVLLRSPGTQNEPTGIKNLVNSSNSFDIDSTDDNTPDQIAKDLVKMMKLVHADGKVPKDRPSYILPEVILMALWVLHDANNNLSSLAMMARDGQLFNQPTETTNQIPTDLGGGSDETEVYYVEGSQYVIADATDIRVNEYDQATIPDGSGNDRNLAEHGEMAVEMVLSHDAGLRHDVGASVANKVDWHTEAF